MDANDTSKHLKPHRHGYEPRQFKSLVSELHRETQQRRPYTDDQAPREAPLVTVTRHLAIATIVLAVISFLGFVAAILQWRALIGADERASETISALRDQGTTMRDQLAEMQNERRAWIAPVGLTFIDPNDTVYPLRVRVSYRNIGQEPAKGVRSWVDGGVIGDVPLPAPIYWDTLPGWHTYTEIKPHNICKHLDETNTHAVLYPSNTGETASLSTNEDQPLKRHVENIRSEHEIFIVIGCFSYTTIGQQKFGTFCFYLYPIPGIKDLTKWQFASCPVGNDDF